jgi:GntR family transcriptional regulator
MPIDPRPDRRDLPAYRQLAGLIRDRINSGELPPGAPLPSELDLITQYGTSRDVPRRAMGLLRSEGLVVSEPGRGFFVRAHRMVRRRAADHYQRELDQLARHPDARDDEPFTADHTGFTTFVLGRTLTEVAADEDLAEAFDVEPGTALLRRTFVFAFDTEPHRRSYSYLLMDMVRGTPITDPGREPWPGGTMAQLDYVGWRVSDDVEEVVTARMPTLDERDELHLDEGVPVMCIRRRMVAAPRDAVLDWVAAGKPGRPRGERVVEVCAPIVIPGDRVELQYRMPLRQPEETLP